MATLEAAAEFRAFTEKQATRFLADQGLTFDEAVQDLGNAVLDAVQLCEWIGY